MTDEFSNHNDIDDEARAATELSRRRSAGKPEVPAPAPPAVDIDAEGAPCTGLDLTVPEDGPPAEHAPG